MDIPKEVCTRHKANPRKIKKPVLKKWCYTPTPESGSDTNTEQSDTNDDTTTVADPDDTETETVTSPPTF